MDDNERNHIKTFDCHGDQNTLGLRWKRWLVGKGLIVNEDNTNNRQRRRALLLHLAGTDVQDIIYTLPNLGDAKDYKEAVDALNAYFVPKVDTTYARALLQTAYTSIWGDNSSVFNHTQAGSEGL